MNPKPMKKYRTPFYPTRLQVLDKPQLLEKHIPSGWRKNAKMAGMVALFLAANACSQTVSIESNAGIVAPIFKHGEGRGAAGCVVVASPVFLSEEEGLQIITEELSKAGIDVTTRNVDFPEICIPQRYEDFTTNTVKVSYRQKALNVDILDKKRNIAVKYVSISDYSDIGGKQSCTTVQGYDLPETAQYLREKIREKGKGVYFGILYDPMPEVDTGETKSKRVIDWNVMERKEILESKRLLRLQVKDFLDWLKGQGVI